MRVRPLPSGTPSAQGVDASGVVLAFLAAVDAAEHIEPHSRIPRRMCTARWATEPSHGGPLRTLGVPRLSV